MAGRVTSRLGFHVLQGRSLEAWGEMFRVGISEEKHGNTCPIWSRSRCQKVCRGFYSLQLFEPQEEENPIKAASDTMVAFPSRPMLQTLLGCTISAVGTPSMPSGCSGFQIPTSSKQRLQTALCIAGSETAAPSRPQSPVPRYLQSPTCDPCGCVTWADHAPGSDQALAPETRRHSRHKS